MKFKRIMGLGLTLVMAVSSVTAGFAEETAETADETEIYEYSEEEYTEETDIEGFEEAEAETDEAIEEISEEPEEVQKTQEEASDKITESEDDIVIEEAVGGDFVVDFGDTVTYAVTGGNITIDTSYGAVIGCDTTVTEAVIPSSYSGVTITSIWGDAFRDCSNLKSVKIPTSVTTIETAAFSGCSSLTAVTIPSSVTSLGERVFYGCSALTTVTINANITEIPEGTFQSCKSLTSINIPSSVTSVGEYAFKYCYALPEISLPDGLTSIGYEAFMKCTGFTSVTIPSAVSEIGNGAFEGCTSMTSFTIQTGDSDKIIEDNAFKDCTALKSAVIPSTVTAIKANAFNGCETLASLTLSEGLTSIGKNAFYSCTALKAVEIPGSVTSIGESAFRYDSALTSLTLNEGLLTIGDYAFGYCSSISSASIPGSVTAVGDSAFAGCTNLSSLTILKGSEEKTIGISAFSGCTSLTKVSLPETVTSVGDYVFGGCTALYTLSLPEGLTSIGGWAFQLCTRLPEVSIPSTVTSIGEGAFTTCSGLTTVYCYEGSTADDASLYPKGVTISYLTVALTPPSFEVRGVFGGRSVKFSSTPYMADIYYSYTTSNITTEDICVSNGETVLFENFYGTIYAKAYYNGMWSNVSRLILKIPTVNTPTITVNGTKATIKSSTPSSYIYYTTDGTTPSLSNGTNLGLNGGTVTVNDDDIIKAIAVRSCFTNSEVSSYSMPNAFDGTVYPPSFEVVGAFGGRNVTFTSNTSKAKIYYSSTTSSLTTLDKCIENGETLLFEDFYGTIYARAYYNGVWSNVARLILKIPTINAPVITYDEGKVTIRTSTPNCYIYYTTDGSTPSMTSGKKLCSNSYGQIIASSGTTVKAIAVRSCFTNSSVVTYKVS